MKRSTRDSWRRDWPLTLTLTLLAIMTYVPFVFTIVNSFKSNQQYFSQFWLPTWPPHFENYSKAWPSISRAILNSFTYSIPTLIIVLTISGLTGYTFARYRFPGRNVLFFSILALIMLPGLLLLVPTFSLIVDIGWVNTIQGVVLPWASVELVLGTFLMRTFFETLPREYFEAARLDGANELDLMFHIAIPLALPSFGALAILDLLFSWNELLWPLIVILDGDKLPVAVGILNFGTQHRTDYGTTFAAYVLASLPLGIIFAVTSSNFMDGLQGGLTV